jgi:hypothetical protein
VAQIALADGNSGQKRTDSGRGTNTLCNVGGAEGEQKGRQQKQVD